MQGSWAMMAMSFRKAADTDDADGLRQPCPPYQRNMHHQED